MNSFKQKSDGKMPLIALLPNLLTIGAICAGLTAIRFALQGNFEISVQFILLACVLDALDGRIARVMQTESPIGAELDSLADFANFGVAPSLILYAWALQDMKSVGWVAVLAFAICCALRLARFNVDTKSEEDDGICEYFVGVPAPAGALLVLLPLFLSFLWFENLQAEGGIIAIYMIVVGFLLISHIPTYSFKNIKIRSQNIKFLLIAFVVFIAMFLANPWYTLVFVDIAYLIVIAWSLITFKER